MLFEVVLLSEAQRVPETQIQGEEIDLLRDSSGRWDGSACNYANCGDTSNILWIEITFDCNHRGISCNKVTNAWWGIGEESSRCSPVSQQIYKTIMLGCVEWAGGQFSIDALSHRVFKGGICASPMGLLTRWRRKEQLSIPVCFDFRAAYEGHSRIVSGNRIFNKKRTHGFLKFPQPIGQGAYIFEGFPVLSLNNIGIFRYRGLRIYWNGPNPIMKIIFDLGQWIEPSKATQKALVTNLDFGLGCAHLTRGGSCAIDGQSIGGHDDTVRGDAGQNTCAMRLREQVLREHDYADSDLADFATNWQSIQKRLICTMWDSISP
jgi:hypothetical protein